jgi:hypothetical protein
MGNSYSQMNAYVNIDTNKLLSMGFNQAEINNLMYVYNNGGKFTPQALQSYGYNYEQAKRLSYMYNICIGKVSMDSKQDMIKHLRKTFGTDYRISIQDLAISKVTEVPRVAVVNNIPDAPYSIWNSSNYKGKDMLYKVIDVSGQNITVETAKKPRLDYGQTKKIPNMLEIKGVKSNGNVVVTFNKSVCRLCNRFIVVASLRNPEFHHGKYEMVCFEGTKVYIYVTNMGTKDKASYNMNNQRVYDYGIFPKDIKPKLDNVARIMYQQLHGVSVEYSEGNKEYRIIEVEKPIDVNEGVTM